MPSSKASFRFYDDLLSLQVNRLIGSLGEMPKTVRLAILHLVQYFRTKQNVERLHGAAGTFR